MKRLTTILSAAFLACCLASPSLAGPGGPGGPGGAGGPAGPGGAGGSGGPHAGPRGGQRGGPGGQRGGQGGQRGGQRPQVPSPAQVFARLDADQDGKISAQEAQAAGAHAAQIMAADADADGFVTLDELRAHVQAQRVTQTFAQLDKNSDGFLDASELGQRGQRLLQADKDGDGKISQQELSDFFAAQAQAAQQQRQSAQAIAQAFRAADSDSNGKLTPGEWPTGAAATHAAVDKNSDGEVTGREVMAYVRANNGQSPF